MAFGIKVDNLPAVQRSLKAADPAVQKQFTKQLRADINRVTAEARAAASWSAQIPPAISTTVGIRSAGIRVSRKKAPIAVLNEFGPWRHPLFGDREHWYPQQARPSVRPAVQANKVKIRLGAERAARAAIAEAGLDGK